MRKKTRQSGFTIIELMVVVAVIAAVMAISVPNFLAARITANESATIANLRTVSSAQAQYQAAARADVDIDGLGEYGTLAEMGGTRGVRIAADGTEGSVMDTSVLAHSFGRLNANGEASRSGYLYRIFLPAQGGTATTEMTEGGDFFADVDIDGSETTWCLYAWPQHVANSGNRAFFVNQRGEVTAADGGYYDGTAAIEPSNAGSAFEAGNPLDAITGEVAMAAIGVDGNYWVLAR